MEGLLVERCGLKMKSKENFFPPSVGGKAVSFLLTAIILIIALRFTGSFFGFGFVNIVGNSMASVYPWGSEVVVLPIKPKDGNYVVAYAKGMDNPEVLKDTEPSLVVKKLNGGKLVSTDDNQTFSQFKIKGKVVTCLPLQRILWWRNKGIQNPGHGYYQQRQERLEAIENLTPAQREQKRRATLLARKNGQEAAVRLIAAEKAQKIIPGKGVSTTTK